VYVCLPFGFIRKIVVLVISLIFVPQILVSRNSVFKSMLSGNMVEAKSGEVHVSDVQPDAFLLFLR